MKKLSIILIASVLLVGCVSKKDVHFKSVELTGATMEGFTPRLTAVVSIANDSHTTLKVSKIAFRLVQNDGTVIANISIPEKLKVVHGDNDLPVTAHVGFNDISVIMALLSDSDNFDVENFMKDLFIEGSAHVKAGFVGKTMHIERMSFMEFMEKIN